MSTAMQGKILVRREGKVAIVQVSRPERKNALTPEMVQDLVVNLEKLAAAPEVGAVVLTGTEDTFMSGMDVGAVTSKVSDMHPVEWRHFRDLIAHLFDVLFEMEKPTVAAINGAAVAGGIGYALACDIRIASDDARFRVGFGRTGLMPTPDICFLLPFVVGLGWAKLLAFTDRFINAQEARQIGLVEEVVPRDDLMPRATELAAQMARGPLRMIAATKEAMNRAYGLNFRALRRMIDDTQFTLTRTDDHQEAISAFLEKREPNYEGR